MINSKEIMMFPTILTDCGFNRCKTINCKCSSKLNQSRDEVIIPTPYWVSYEEIFKMAGAKIVPIETTIESDFKITADQLKNAINERTKLMIYSSPCNPSGSVYSKDELRILADVLVRHSSVVVVSDEIYEHINFTDSYFSMAAFDDMYPQVVTVNGVSKSFAMTGWRLGYIGAPEWIARLAQKFKVNLLLGLQVFLNVLLLLR